MTILCSKAVNNAVDLFKYFGSKGSVIRYDLFLLKTFDVLCVNDYCSSVLMVLIGK